MRSIHALALFAALACPFILPTPAGATDPVGESGVWELDWTNGRTSRYVASGGATAAITEFLPDLPAGPAYNVRLEYDLTIYVHGNEHSTLDIALSSDFFTPEFLARLRAEKTWVGPQFTIDYLGRRDATNLDGAVYTDCDYLYFHDISMGGASPSGERMIEAKDLKMWAHLKEGVSMLGVTKLDLFATMYGLPIRLGYDLRR